MSEAASSKPLHHECFSVQSSDVMSADVTEFITFTGNVENFCLLFSPSVRQILSRSRLENTVFLKCLLA